MLREAFCELTIRVLHAYETVLAEGDGHNGQSALVGLVASRRIDLR